MMGESDTRNSVMIDGFTLHAASLSNITYGSYKKLNKMAQECLNTLIQSVILHQSVHYIPEIIQFADRYPRAADVLADAVIQYRGDHNAFISPQVIHEIARVKSAYNELKRAESYEEALVNFVQKMFFESTTEPTEEVLCIEDPALYGIFLAHQKLRTRAYTAITSGLEIPYLVSPYRKKLCSDASIVARDILESYVSTIRNAEDARIKSEWSSISVEIDVPPLTSFLFNKMGKKGRLLETALTIRDSVEAKDFRAMCKELFTSDLEEASRIRSELSAFVGKWSGSLHRDMRTTSKMNASISIENIIKVSFPLKLPDWAMERRFQRKAHLFIYNVAKAGRLSTTLPGSGSGAAR